jgi:hypothetical protein
VQQSNNVAPVPPPRQEKDAKGKVHPEIPNLPRPAVDPINNWKHHAYVPAGVVPAPQGYAYHHNAQERRVRTQFIWLRIDLLKTFLNTVINYLCSIKSEEFHGLPCD